MGDRTGIQWTDATWNPIRGCSRVSAGCVNCYAEKVAHRFSGPGQPYEGLVDAHGRWNGVVQVVEERLADPIRWQRARRIFVNSMSDLFHESLPDESIDRVFAVMALAGVFGRGHVFQILTKRPERMRDYLRAAPRRAAIEAAALEFTEDGDVHVANSMNDVLGKGRNIGWPMRNVWLGTSVEDDRVSDRIAMLQQVPAAVRFLSCEPLIGPLDLWDTLTDIHWVIVGGESGTGARPCDVEWVGDVVAACFAHAVPVFVKQLGAVPMEPEESWRGRMVTRVLNVRNRDKVPVGYVPLLMPHDPLKGGDPRDWPTELGWRQFPTAEFAGGAR